MTAIPEELNCVQGFDLDGDQQLTVDDVWPQRDVDESSFGGGGLRRASDAAGCQAVLPARPTCEVGYPWLDVQPETLDSGFLASEADRVVTGMVALGPADAGGGPSAGPSLTYTVHQYPDPNSAARMLSWLTGAAKDCAAAVPATVGGRPGWAGAAKAYDQGPAPFVLVAEADSIVALTFDGKGWSATERDRVSRIALPRLLTQ